VWWHKAHHAEENEALKEVVAAFEQETGKQVEITFVPLEEQPSNIEAAFEARRPPDIAFGFWLIIYIPGWAFDYRLVDLTDTVGHFSDLFDPKQLDRALLLNARTGRKAMYGLPMGQISAADHPRVRRGGADPEEARVVPGDPDRERTEERHRRQTHQPEHISGAPVRPLRFVRRLSGPSLLVVDGLRASFSRHTGDLRGFRRAMGRARQRLGVIYGGCGEPIAQRLSRPWMLALRLSRPPAARRCRGRGFGKRCCCP
jgi:hypothetical protein